MEWLMDRTRMERMAGGVGAAASLICGIHCMAVPLFSAVMLFAGVSLRSQVSLEFGLMAASFVLALVAFLPSAIEGRNAFALQAAVLAMVFFVAAWQMASLGALLRQSLSVSASLMLLVAHGQNLWRLRQTSASAACALRHCRPQP